MTTFAQLHLIPMTAISAYTPFSLGAAPIYRDRNGDEYVALIKGDGGAFRPFDERNIKKPCMVSIFRSKAEPRIRRRFIPIRLSRYGISFRGSRKASKYQMSYGYMQSALKTLLAKRFSNDFNRMAYALDMRIKTLRNYLNGELPRNANTVRDMSRRLDVNERLLVGAWKADAYEAIDFVHPIPEGVLPLGRELVKLVRKATIRLGGLNPVHDALRNTGFPSHPLYAQWNEVFRGILKGAFPATRPDSRKRSTIGSFRRHAPEILSKAGVISQAEATLLIEDAWWEKFRYQHNESEIPMEVDGDAIDEAMWLAWTPDPRISDSFEHASLVELGIITLAALKRLTPREEKVLRMRFGIREEREYTQDEVAEDFEITRQRIDQIENKALIKLRDNRIAKRLRPFWED